MDGKILILTDGKAGHENQSRAFARALGRDCDVVEVHFKFGFSKVLSYFYDRALNRLDASLFGDSLEKIIESGVKYAAVIGTGSGTFYAAKVAAARLGVKSGVVLYPRGYRLSTFGCVLAPVFDNPAKLPNVVEIPANLVANDAAFYEQGVAAFFERHHPSARDAVAVIVGGPNKCSTMTEQWMRGELERVFADNAGCEFWVTTSRRTPPEVEAVVDAFPFDYKLLYSRERFNPIPAFVKLAKKMYVTAESTGMLSESCTFGSAEVHALDNLKAGRHKFRRFVDKLVEAGYLEGNRKVDLSVEFARAKELMNL